MEELIIKSTEDTPQIELNASSGVFQITGRSLPENAETIYSPVVEWLNNYIKNPNSSTTFIFKLDYFNSASSKQIYNVLFLLQKLHEETNSVTIQWMYKSGDDLMREEGEEFSLMLYVPIELVAY